MSVFHSLQEARDFFSKDLFATSNNMTLDALTEDGAVCGMEITGLNGPGKSSGNGQSMYARNSAMPA